MLDKSELTLYKDHIRVATYQAGFLLLVLGCAKLSSE